MRCFMMCLLIGSLFGSSASIAAEKEKPLYSKAEVDRFCKEFQLRRRAFHFPEQSFLEAGYAPPGGYVKDFGVIKHNGRYHLFHIDGRPEEKCTESGNEISFGHASTANLRHWIRHRMPLAVGDRPWENEHVWAPFVTRWQGRFYMFYMASGRHTSGVLTYAVSDDLETWTKWPGGAIETARGRDPFVRVADGVIYLYFTATRGGIQVVTSRDMQQWSEAEFVYRNPKRLPAESCSVHRLGDRWVLWFNDYLHSANPSGDFRPVYVVSDDPLKFDSKDLKVFHFTTSLPTQYGENDWLEKRPIPISIELLEEGKDAWLVAYFRWHIDRFRLFVGVLRWDTDPASIEEILSPEHLERVRAELAEE
ncbi:MAG: hypothetical protein GX621_02125 [Pirellulaceae bacterium]|nr:hypothetical protein [Pirellulaceae bacterium]